MCAQYARTRECVCVCVSFLMCVMVLWRWRCGGVAVAVVSSTHTTASQQHARTFTLLHDTLMHAPVPATCHTRFYVDTQGIVPEDDDAGDGDANAGGGRKRTVSSAQRPTFDAGRPASSPRRSKTADAPRKLVTHPGEPLLWQFTTSLMFSGSVRFEQLSFSIAPLPHR